jgi:hypothetical protein
MPGLLRSSEVNANDHAGVLLILPRPGPARHLAQLQGTSRDESETGTVSRDYDAVRGCTNEIRMTERLWTSEGLRLG